MLVANCPDQKVSDYLFKKLMVIPFVLLAVGALLSVLGVFSMTV